MALKIFTVVGARPQFVKAAALSRVLRATAGIEEVLVHTGQHFDANMSDVFFSELGIPAPEFNLDIHGGNHGAMTGRMLGAVEQLMLGVKPDFVLVYGDTNSTLAGALAAAKLHIPVAHVEAGLRSFNRRMPEEVNRVLTDHVSELLFCPTRAAVDNLSREGISDGVHRVGDVMYDATLHAKAMADRSTILDRLGIAGRSYTLATIHRAENTDDAAQLGRVIDYLRDHAGSDEIVLPLHPRTRQAAARLGVSLAGIRIIDPVGYLDMARLLDGCTQVMTDSGGVQKEAYFHRKPCVTLRTETEWVETIDCGWNRLWTVPEYRQRREIGDYGQGDAAGRMAELLLARA